MHGVSVISINISIAITHGGLKFFLFAHWNSLNFPLQYWLSKVVICTDITNAMVVRCIPQKEDILWSEPVECYSWHRLDALVAILTVHLVYVFNVVDQESFLAVSDGGIWNWDVSFQPKVLCYFIACFYFLCVFFILRYDQTIGKFSQLIHCDPFFYFGFSEHAVTTMLLVSQVLTHPEPAWFFSTLKGTSSQCWQVHITEHQTSQDYLVPDDVSSMHAFVLWKASQLSYCSCSTQFFVCLSLFVFLFCMSKGNSCVTAFYLTLYLYYCWFKWSQRLVQYIMQQSHFWQISATW